MEPLLSRREIVSAALILAADATLLRTADGLPLRRKEGQVAGKKARMKLGLITYNLAKDWDLPTILDHVKKAGWDGVELQECGKSADAHGVEIFLEVHGGTTQNPPNIRTILDHCGHPRVGACWNSNPTDLLNGSVKTNFELLAPDIKSCHINDLWSE